MVALMCCCCREKPSYSLDFIELFRFYDYYEIDTFGNYIVECSLSAPFYSRFFVSQANYNVGEGYVSPPLDDPDNGDWNSGFFNNHRGRFYKTPSAPDLAPIFDDVLSYYHSLTSFDYGGAVVSYFVSPFLNPSDFLFENVSFGSAFDFFRSRAIDIYSACASGSFPYNRSDNIILGVKVSKNATI
ncbi:hypothetical protein [Campylobacter showae]|uniref:hypothetical protein n=1 Tax=Campylobacter showae TaxID=204 RepID=UPI000F08A9A9|nr:hypothetical protein [Campylobacter showae]